MSLERLFYRDDRRPLLKWEEHKVDLPALGDDPTMWVATPFPHYRYEIYKRGDTYDLIFLQGEAIPLTLARDVFSLRSAQAVAYIYSFDTL